jgi:hypothetical protein
MRPGLGASGSDRPVGSRVRAWLPGSRMVVLICAKKTAHCAGAAARDDKLDTRAEPCAPREAYVRHVA